ncbi:MAG: DUF5011 domain-containing protein [Gammaproteobacteria bacterium]|nr:DUF5011 domain-containing protein [Gammaproteobacteria bacterium]MBU1776475.1 DUF5011 domain-containing protein [Gammaproteobacteria bacterium]MBU1968892.1 DUF5011 domain-containing protein [Gammaproteobacteria bacterium]
MIHHSIKFLICTAILFCASSLAHAEIAAAARILVFGTHQGGNIVYHYKVINTGNVAIHDFVIGSEYDQQLGDEYPQLLRRPLGWEYGQEGETGTEIILAPASTSQPTNWTSELIGQEGAAGSYYLQWETTPADNSYGIPAGQTLSGFSATVPLVDVRLFPRKYYNATQTGTEQDDIYLTGNFKVKTWDSQNNDIQNYWGKLEIEDTTPPSLSLTLSPNELRKNKKHVPITATIAVKDDHDPQPEINLVSITCNETIEEGDIKVGKLFTDIRQFELKADHDGKSHAGRIYTVTYIAIDGSGNQTMATATVSVPHDRRKHEERRDKDEKKDKDKNERSR